MTNEESWRRFPRSPSRSFLNTDDARNEEARTVKAGFYLQVVVWERRYAELSYLLPLYSGLAVKTRCVGPPSSLTSYMYPITVWTFGYASVGHGAQPQPIFCLRC